ncbi:ribonuclease H-like domain-containing protein [Tanacetum coccineum]
MSQPANDEFSQHLSDDEESNHEDASDTGAAPKQQQQVIPQTTAISNIKLPILKKEEYDIWAMEMEHYLEYIDNEVWKAAEIQAVEKERKAKNILLMAIPKEHMRSCFSNTLIEAFNISILEGLVKGYLDRFQPLLSQLDAHGAEVSTEDANHKFLRSLPTSWKSKCLKTSSSAQNVALIHKAKAATNKVKSGFYYCLQTCTPLFFNQYPEKEVPAGFADEVIYSLFAKQSEDWDLLHEDMEQIYDLDIEEMDINWQIAMIAIRMKKFYKKTGRRVRVDGKTHVGFDKKKLECFNCHNTDHFARECTAKGTHDGKKKRDSFYQHQEAGNRKN